MFSVDGISAKKGRGLGLAGLDKTALSGVLR